MLHTPGRNLSKISYPQLFLVIGLFSLVFFPAQPAYAQGGEPPNNVPAGQTIADDLYLSGPQVTVDGNVDGDLVAIGQNITINGDVSGSLVTAGWGKTVINGKISGSVYAVAGVFEMGPESAIQRSLYLVSGLVALQSGSSIGRDFTAICLSAVLNGAVERDTKAMIGLPSLLNFLLERPNLLGSSQGLLNNLRQRLQRPASPTPAPAAPTSTPSSMLFDYQLAGLGAGVSGHSAVPSKTHLITVSWSALPSLLVAQFPVAQPPPAAPLSVDQTSGIDWQQVGDWLFVRLREIVALLLIGLLMLWKGSAFVMKTSARVKQAPFRSAGLGFVGYITGIAAIVFALVLIVALGLFFAMLTLWNLALLTWAVGLGVLLLASVLFALAIGWVSQVIISFLFGDLLLNKIAPNLKRRSFWSLLLGILIYVLIHSIPILGMVIAFLVMIAGFGAILFFLPSLQLRKSQPALEV